MEGRIFLGHDCVTVGIDPNRPKHDFELDNLKG
jgi:hypothetical protein